MHSYRHSMPLASIAALLFALSIGLSGCGRGIWTRIHVWMDETKKVARPEDVRTALVPFFSYQGRSDGTSIYFTNQLPTQISSLPIFSANPTNIDVWCPADRSVLYLSIGSGFGHWGIVVLPPGRSEDFSNHPEVIPWGDGVYFYDDYK